jgi:hypothetical protein
MLLLLPFLHHHPVNFSSTPHQFLTTASPSPGLTADSVPPDYCITSASAAHRLQYITLVTSI